MKGLKFSVFFMAGLVPLCLFSTTMKFLSLEELTEKADLILTGKCTEKNVHRSEEGRLIVTDYKIEVEKIFKGDLRSKKIIVRQPGGELDGIGMMVSGTARFEINEKVLVFAGKEEGGVRALIGMAQGKFTVYIDPKTKKEYVKRDIGGIDFITKTKREVDGKIPFSELTQRIEKLLKASQSKKR